MSIVESDDDGNTIWVNCFEKMASELAPKSGVVK
jgi:hypothetical protein